MNAVRALAGLAFAAALAAQATASAAAEIVVALETVLETKAVFGQVESRNVVPARARIGGTIRSIAVEEGSEVQEGEVIAIVVDDKIALQLDAADAEVDALRSQLENAETELTRAEQLLSRGVAPQSRVDQARTQVDVYTNQLVAAEANRSVVLQQSREGEVLAPASGRVLSVPVTPGTVVLPGEALARIAGGGYFLRLSLPERHAAEIREGDTVVVGERMLSGAGAAAMTTRDGRLAKIYPEIAEGRVEADVEVAGLGDYFVGERTLVWIPVGRRQVIALPSAALTTRHGIDIVRIATDAGEMEVAVIVGETLIGDGNGDNGARVEILTGLKEGDRVVLP